MAAGTIPDLRSSRGESTWRRDWLEERTERLGWW